MTTFVQRMLSRDRTSSAPRKKSCEVLYFAVVPCPASPLDPLQPMPRLTAYPKSRWRVRNRHRPMMIRP